MKWPRLSDWTLLALVLLALLAWTAPQNLGVVAYKALLVAIAVVGAYWADRGLYKRMPRLRLDDGLPYNALGAARIVARALIFLGCVLGLTLGL